MSGSHSASAAENPGQPFHYLITGASGGVGRALRASLTRHSTALSCWDLPEVDVTDVSSVEKAYEQAVAQNGPIDVLIHAAGVLRADSALSPDDEAIEESLAVNLGGVIRVCSLVAADMVARKKGSIVVVSSNAARVPRVGMAAYSASKAACTSWVKTLALECAPHGVRVNLVSPGSTYTPMLQGMWPSGADHERELSRVIAGSPEQYRLGIPLQRVAQPEEIASACLWLSSDLARHITMHDLRVDGGATFDV